jgi:hypothetical protein
VAVNSSESLYQHANPPPPPPPPPSSITAAGKCRLSSKDWAAFRQRLTRQWALRYHKIGRWAGGWCEDGGLGMMGVVGLEVGVAPR